MLSLSHAPTLSWTHSLKSLPPVDRPFYLQFNKYFIRRPNSVAPEPRRGGGQREELTPGLALWDSTGLFLARLYRVSAKNVGTFTFELSRLGICTLHIFLL